MAFETDEGTWLSLDVSPDGKQIVFELLGDLYTLPIEGGRATPLTAGMAFDSQPRYSPDGSRIAFVTDRGGADNVWIMDADGSSARQLTNERIMLFVSPEWTPEGDAIVVSKGGRFDEHKLWLYHVDGGAGIDLTAGEGFRDRLNAVGAAFGPDPRYVWFAVHYAWITHNLLMPAWQLARLDRSTGRMIERSSRQNGGFRPVLSPDGRWLAYGSRHEARTGWRLRDLESGDERWLIYPVDRDLQASRYTRDIMPGSSFLPDGSAFVTSFDGKIQRVSVPHGAHRVIPFVAQVERELGPDVRVRRRVEEGPVQVRQIRFPRLSPQGDRVVFSALDRIYVQELPDGTPRRLTGADVGEHHPTWSPDGSSIAYVAWADRPSLSVGHVMRVASEGGVPDALTPAPGYYSFPRYSPDGTRLVFVRASAAERAETVSPQGYGGTAEVVWMPAGGGPLQPIVGVDPFRAPHFGADPERVFVYEGDEGLSSYRFDGTERRVHLKVTRNPTVAMMAPPIRPSDDVLMGPDGRRVLVLSDRKLYRVTLPEVATAPVVSTANLAGSPLPIRRITSTGAEFPAWSTDGESVTYSLGRTLYVCDLEDLAEESPCAPHEYEVAIAAPRDRPTGVVALRGARIITMVGDEVIESGDVVIRNHRIESVGPSGTIDLPDEATVLDARGNTVIPGLVDIHAHPRAAWGVHRTQVWEFLANLAYGVTTLHDPQTSTTDVLTYSDLIETGQVLGPRLYSTGPALWLSDDVRSLQQARDLLGAYAHHWDTGTVKMYVAGNRQQRQWIIMAARELGLMATTEGAIDTRIELTHILDGYSRVEHAFPVTTLYRDIVEVVARSGATYTPTLLVQYGAPWAENYFFSTEDVSGNAKLRRFTPYAEIEAKARRRERWFAPTEFAYAEAAASAGAIVAAGGNVGLGGHGQLQGLGSHWELWALAAGMPNHDALRVATRLGAAAIGLDRDLGTVEAGKLADLLVLRENPLEEIRNTDTIRYVVKNGVVFDGDTLDRLWPDPQPLPRQYWWDLDPRPRGDATPRR